MSSPLRWFSQLALCALAACARGTAAPDFTLTDQQAQPWSLSAQHRVTALFFGYSHCPDTCPTTLAKLSKALAGIPNAQVAFVTVDPERDTPAVLKHYVTKFSGAPIVALTGSLGQIAATEAAYHVWSQKIPGRRGKYDYDESHLSYVFLIDRNGYQRGILHDEDSLATVREAARGISE